MIAARTRPAVRQNPWWATALLFFAAVLIAIVLAAYLPVMVDWKQTFSQMPEHFLSPYDNKTFVSFPYLVFFLPYALLPANIGNAVNILINIAVFAWANHKFKGGYPGLFLTLTSAFFIDLLRLNNIDWLPLLGMTLPPQAGLILLSLKPQTLAGAGLIWLKRHGPKIFIPIIAVLFISLFVWWGWPLTWWRSIHYATRGVWNFSPFPYFIPVGIGLLFWAWKKDDDVLAAMATGCFFPYFGAYSLAPLIAIAGSKHRWAAIALWIFGWAYAVIKANHLA